MGFWEGPGLDVLLGPGLDVLLGPADGKVGTVYGGIVVLGVGADTGADIGACTGADIGACTGADMGADMGACTGADMGLDISLLLIHKDILSYFSRLSFGRYISMYRGFVRFLGYQFWYGGLFDRYIFLHGRKMFNTRLCNRR